MLATVAIRHVEAGPGQSARWGTHILHLRAEAPLGVTLLRWAALRTLPHLGKIPEDPNNAQALVVARAPRSREHAGWQALADSFQQLHGQPPKEVLKAVKANAVKGSCVVDYKADGSWSLELAPDNAQKKRKITKDMEDEGGNKKIHR
eukprot:jgi/Mesen1/415/ME000100S10655